MQEQIAKKQVPKNAYSFLKRLWTRSMVEIKKRMIEEIFIVYTNVWISLQQSQYKIATVVGYIDAGRNLRNKYKLI